MLYKSDHTLHDLWVLAFFSQDNSLEIHPLLCVFIVHSFSLLSSIPWYEYLNINLLKDIWVFSVFSFCEQSCYKYPCTVFSMNISFHFSVINSQEYNCCVIWLHVWFYKKLLNCFPECLYHFTFLPTM